MIDGKIPIVDLDDFFSENTKREFVNSVGSALEVIGFFAVKNHSISPSILNEIVLRWLLCYHLQELEILNHCQNQATPSKNLRD